MYLQRKKKSVLDVLLRSWEFIKPHSQFATCKLAWNVLFLGKGTQKAKKWTASSWGEEREVPRENRTVFLILSDPCLLHMLQKQANKSRTRHFWVTCQTPLLLAANPYLGFQLPRPSPFCQNSFSLQLCHLLPPAPNLFLSQTRLLFLHFISLKKIWFKAHWNPSIDFNGLWIGPNVFVSCRHPQLLLTQSFLFSCKVPFIPFHPAMQYATKTPLLLTPYWWWWSEC